MEDSTAFGLFAVVAMILAAGALVVSLSVSNPLLLTGTFRTAAVVVVGVTVAVVVVATALAVRGRALETPYW